MQLAILYVVAFLALLTGFFLCSALTLAKGSRQDQALDDEAQMRALAQRERRAAPARPRQGSA